MTGLEDGQTAIMRAIDRGPAYLPSHLFAGSPARLLAGMKVHANTISHARLLALEETFPRTREVIGHERFNQHSRTFLEQPGVTANALPIIGTGFAQFLVRAGEAADIAELALFEWLWLRTYHSSEAEPLELSSLAGKAPDELLALKLVPHPAATARHFGQLVRDIIGAEVPEVSHAVGILMTRPQAEVLLSAASDLMIEVLARAQGTISIGNLFGETGEQHKEGAAEISPAMEALVALFNAGALVAA